jgi:PPK2 family polyphosphate:nucleotide phosphotransferase
MLLQPIPPGRRIRLTDAMARPAAKVPHGEEANRLLTPLVERLARWQVALYAEGRRALLVVLQGRDAAGKDGVVRRVFGPLDARGLVVTPFKRPTDYELAHDYLWRVHRAVPIRGTIGVFNRSHYEDVLVVRVHRLVPRQVWSRRYEQINAFEKLLTDEGVTILKFFLHISRAEQKARLLERLKDPTKNWKFDVVDLEERHRWPAYTRAIEDMLSRTSTPWAPWYLVPANRKASRDLMVAEVIAREMDRMHPRFPRVDPEVLKQARAWEREGAGG